MRGTAREPGNSPGRQGREGSGASVSGHRNRTTGDGRALRPCDIAKITESRRPARSRSAPGGPGAQGAEGSHRQQRLPAAARRYPVVRARAGLPDAGRVGGRLRAFVGRRRRLRCETAVPGHQAPDLADAAGAVGGPPRRADPAGTRVRHGAVRGRRAARAARAVAAPGGGPAAGGDYARARGGLGGAAGGTWPAAPDRRADRRGHLPGRVLPHAAGPGAVARRHRADGAARARRGHQHVPARNGRGPRSGNGMAWAAARWLSACRGWSGARARTP